MHPVRNHTSVSDDIEISDVTIKASTVIASITLSIGTEFKHVFHPLGRSKEATVTLAPNGPALPSSTPLIINVNMDSFIHNLRFRRIEIRRQDMSSNASTVDATNKRKYRTSINGIEVTIWFIVPPQPEIIPVTPVETTSSLQTAPEVENVDLRSTTDKLFDICPRFRVLVIGRTGAGKTSLIEKTFGVQGLRISHKEVGECDINQELSADDENKRFVLHDSKGFEPGDKDNFDTAMKFLDERKRKPDIKDRVHAVWLCFTIPVSADRLLEKGTEKFLQSLSEGELDGLPIIAVFTKFDTLVNRVRIRNVDNFAKLNEKDAKERAINEAITSLEELCFKPFRKQVVGMTRHIPEIAVSTFEDYNWTLNELTRLTTQVVRDYVTEEAAMLSVIAQQVNPDMKIDAVIAIGKKRYWKGLAAIASNQRETVLQNIHQDIVRVWNLNDPTELLDSDHFKTLVATMVSEQTQSVLTMDNITTDLSMLGVLAGIIGALAGPAAPIVMPIAAVAVVSHWTILLFREVNVVLQQVMNYIVALTFIMHIIFAITTGTNNVVSRRLINLALKTFEDSLQRRKIHSEIKEHLRPLTAPFGRDAALAKLTELIQNKCITSEEMNEIKRVVSNFDAGTDEPWNP